MECSNKRDDRNLEIERAYEAYAETLFYFLYRKTKDRMLAEELLQETYIKAILHWDQRKDKKRTAGWLYRIAENEFRQHYRRRSVFGAAVPLRPDAEEFLWEEIPDPQAELEEQLLKKEEFKTLERVLSCLSQEEQYLLRLRWQEEREFSEIAQMTGLNVNTAKVKVHRAVKKCRDIYKELERKEGK